MSDLIKRMRDGPEMKLSESGWFSYPDIISTENLLDEAAEALEARDKLIAELVESLKPVANMEMWTESASDNESVIMTVGTIRRMRSVYSKAKEQE